MNGQNGTVIVTTGFGGFASLARRAALSVESFVADAARYASLTSVSISAVHRSILVVDSSRRRVETR